MFYTFYSKKLKSFYYYISGKEEVVCDNCDGHGSYRIRMRTHICSKCLGAGKLDWIELCMGKNKRSVGDEPPSEKSVRTYISEYAKSAK